MIHVQDTCHTALHGTLRHSGTFHIHTVRGQSRWSTKQRISMKNTENSFEKYIQEIYTSKASYHVRGWFNNICNGCDVNDDKKKTLKINVAVFDLRESTLVVLTPFWLMQVFSDRWQSQTAPEYSEVHTHFPQEQFPWAGP